MLFYAPLRTIFSPRNFLKAAEYFYPAVKKYLLVQVMQNQLREKYGNRRKKETVFRTKFLLYINYEFLVGILELAI